MHDPNNTLYFFLGRLWQQNVSVILGPVETCVHEVNNNQSQLAQALQELVVTHVQARMAAAFNLPMLSYYCQHAETSDKVAFPTFIRTRWEPREFFSTQYVCEQLRIIFEIFFSVPLPPSYPNQWPRSCWNSHGRLSRFSTLPPRQWRAWCVNHDIHILLNDANFTEKT